MQTSQAPATTPPTTPARALYDEEVALHSRICGGDASAVLECVDRFGALLYCALLWRTGDIETAERLTERAFVSLWRSPVAFDPARGPMAFQLLRSLRPLARENTRSPSRSGG